MNENLSIQNSKLLAVPLGLEFQFGVFEQQLSGTKVPWTFVVTPTLITDTFLEWYLSDIVGIALNWKEFA